jgi:EamA domain-containing membrane protein RarD
MLILVKIISNVSKKTGKHKANLKKSVLLLFCLGLAGLSMILFIINGVAVNIGHVLIISLGIFIMLFCFLVGGLGAGTLKNRFWGWFSIVIAWFAMALWRSDKLTHFCSDKLIHIT